MIVDRYTKIVLSLIAVALVAIAAHSWLPDSRLPRLVSPPTASAETAVPKYEITIPKSWGKLLNYSNNNLLLEASDGSLRIVDVEGRPPEYPRVKVLIRWQ
jgi:hypothetical protein